MEDAKGGSAFAPMRTVRRLAPGQLDELSPSTQQDIIRQMVPSRLGARFAAVGLFADGALVVLSAGSVL